MRLWRISNHADLSGVGGDLASGRWHDKPRRIVYCADSAAAALLEITVQHGLTPDGLPEAYQLIEIEAPDDIPLERIALDALPEKWRDNPKVTRGIGNGFLDRNQAALLVAPSAVAPHTWNFLLNPRHPASAAIRIASAERYPLDPRLRR